MLQYGISYHVQNKVRECLVKLITFLKNYWLLVIMFLIASIPLLKMGFTGDDINNTLVKGAILRNDWTLLGFFKDRVVEWMHRGRLVPVAFLTTYTFSYILGPNLLLYNFFHWCVVVTSYILTGFFLKKLDLPASKILLFFGFLPLCWSLYPGSSLVAFAIILPVLVILAMMVFINYIDFLKTRYTKYIIFSTFFSLLAFFTYELAVFLIMPIIVLLNKYYERKFFLKNKSAYLIFLMAFLYLALILFIRYFFPVTYPGIAIGNLKDIPVAFLFQLSGALPLSNFFHFLRNFQTLNWITYSLILLLIFGNFIFIYHYINREPIPRAKYIFFIGILFLVVPAFIMSISKKYQFETSFGISYIQVFIQQIGFTMIIMIFSQWIFSLQKMYLPQASFLVKVLLSSLLSIMIGLSFLANNLSTNYWNKAEQYSRDIYQKAVQQGLFNQLPRNAIILRPGIRSPERHWNTNDFYKLLINRDDLFIYDFLKGTLTQAYGEKNYQKQIEINLSGQPLHKAFFVDFKNLPNTGRAGYAFLGHVMNKEGAFPNVQFKLEDVKIFYTSTSQKNLKMVLSDMADQYNLKSNPQFINQVNLLISQSHVLSGWIYFPDGFTFYWKNNSLWPALL